MGETAYNAYKYSLISVSVFGILGNILVIFCIARQKQLLKKNYYFLVLHLAICDLGEVTMLPLSYIALSYDVYLGFNIFCLFFSLDTFFLLSGVAMMLMISLLRYRATVHPLKPAISRVKLIKFCCVVYVVSLVFGLGQLTVPQCINNPIDNRIFDNPIYLRFVIGFGLFLSFVLTISIIVCYGKIGLAIVKQNRRMKRMGSAAVTNRHNRDRRIFLVCLCTVVCFAVGRSLISVASIWIIAGKYALLAKHVWVFLAGFVLTAAGTNSANPVIYGILDKSMFKFLKLCRKKRQIREDLAMQEI